MHLSHNTSILFIVVILLLFDSSLFYVFSRVNVYFGGTLLLFIFFGSLFSWFLLCLIDCLLVVLIL